MLHWMTILLAEIALKLQVKQTYAAHAIANEHSSLPGIKRYEDSVKQGVLMH